MKALRAFEAWIVRAEAAVAVSLVLLMLTLAGYNVLYRNILVPMQKHWAHSGPPLAEAPVVAEAKPAAGVPEQKADGAAEGFGGDWGEDDGAPEPDAKAPSAAPDAAPGAAEGFGGDWGEDGDAEPDAKDPSGDAKAAPEDDDDEAFAKLAHIDAAKQKDDDGEPKGGPPPAGSFAAQMVAAIDAVKLSWIDVVLRQLVILVSFFGAMMATQRGKHINVDVFGKLIGPRGQRWLAVATNLLATCVCFVFARAGAGLVAISREHPHELVPWADEWMFQTMFPFGFGLLAFHFGVQMLAALAGEQPATPEAGGAA